MWKYLKSQLPQKEKWNWMESELFALTKFAGLDNLSMYSNFSIVNLTLTTVISPTILFLIFFYNYPIILIILQYRKQTLVSHSLCLTCSSQHLLNIFHNPYQKAWIKDWGEWTKDLLLEKYTLKRKTNKC